jgi:hypothetical protein
MLENAIQTDLLKFKQSSAYINFPKHRRTASSHFTDGMAARLNARIKVMIADKEKKAEEARLKRARTTGIVNVPSLIERKLDLVDEDYKKEFKTNKVPGAVHGKAKHYTSAYFDGKNAADKINLGRPIEGDDNTQLLLN